MAAVFDPQFKLSIVECCLGKLDMSTRDANVKNLRDKLSILVETYDKNPRITHLPLSHVRLLRKKLVRQDQWDCLGTTM